MFKNTIIIYLEIVINDNNNNRIRNNLPSIFIYNIYNKLSLLDNPSITKLQ